jgi:hypothetical protein
VIAGMNTGRGHDLLGVCEVRTVTLPGWAACRALGVPADLLGFVIAQLVSTAWPIANLALSESRRRPGLARLPAMAETGRLEFAPFS